MCYALFMEKTAKIKSTLFQHRSDAMYESTHPQRSSLVKITFCGGTGSVTGANFLLEVDGKKILIDCGLTQGMNLADNINWDPFPYESKEIDILFITHAHVDHLGRVPKLLHEGFRGKIYSTKPTKSLALPMLLDTTGILCKNTDLGLDKIYTE